MVSTPKYDLFISYADADSAWVKGYLLDALKQAGVSYHSEAAFTLGKSQIQEFKNAIKESQRILLVLSPDYLGDNVKQFIDFLAQAYDLKRATWSVIPLVLKPVEVPVELEMLVGLDATNSEEWGEVIERLCTELQLPIPAASPKPDCPYPGMKPFTSENTGFFYGRDPEINNLLLRLRKQDYFFIIGPSGSGKSSFIFAGLVPKLEEQQPGKWLVKSFRPGQNPINELLKVLAVSHHELENFLGVSQQQVAEFLRDSSIEIVPTVEQSELWVNSALAEAQPDCHLLLIIDQFEELFSQAPKKVQTAFITAIQNLRQVQKCSIILAMRADFYSDLMNSSLGPIQDFERVEITPLRGDKLRKAIATPAEKSGVYIESRLLERLLTDAADEPGVLPLIQETMVLLWEQMERRLLTLKAYKKLGKEANQSGLSVAISLHADATFAQLGTDEKQAIARRIFIRLVQFGEGRADTRRQQLEIKLKSAKDDLNLFQETLEHLIKNRLLTPSSEDGRKIDIAHETIIESWGMLQGWLKEWRKAEQTRRKLETKGNNWEDLRREGGLLDAVELKEAEDWINSPDAAELGYPENLLDLVKASRNTIEDELTEAKKTARTLRNRLVIAISLTVVAVMTAIGTVIGFRQATVERQRAEEQARIATSRQLAAQANSYLLGNQIDSALLFSIKAYQTNSNFDTRDSLLTALEHSPHIAAFLRSHTSNPSVGGIGVYDVAFSRDGKILASVGRDGQVILWDVGKRKLTRKILANDRDTHVNGINSVSISPDGRIVASGGADGLWLWDAETGAKLTKLESRIRPEFFGRYGLNKASLVSFSHESTRALTVNSESSRSYPNHISLIFFNEVYDLVFSTDGKILVSVGNGVSIWNVEKRQLIKRLVGHKNFVKTVAISPNGEIIASGSCARDFNPDARSCDRGEVRLWDAKTGEQIGQPLTGHAGSIYSLAFSPDGTTIASGSADNTLRLWNAKTGEQIGQSLTGHIGTVFSVAFSPDGKIIASGSADNTLRFWDAKTGRRIGKQLTGHRDTVSSVVFSPDGKTLASGSNDNKVILWNAVTDGSVSQLLTSSSRGAESVAFSPNGKILASSGSDGKIRLWNLETGESLDPLVAASDEPIEYTTEYSHVTSMSHSFIESVAFNPEGKVLASGALDGVIILWNVKTGERIGEPLQHPGEVRSVAFSPSDKIFASGGSKTIILWDSTTGERIGEPLTGHDDDVYSVAFSPDGKKLASVSCEMINPDTRTCGQGEIRLWNVETKKQIGQPLIGHTYYVKSVAFSPDGKLLATGSGDSRVILWDMTTNQPINHLVGHSGTVNRVVFSPDGKILASGSDDHKIILWDVVSGKQITHPLRDPYTTHQVNDIAFSPDGKMLASALFDGNVVLWDVSIESWQSLACNIASRNLTATEWEQVSEAGSYQKICPKLPVHASVIENKLKQADSSVQGGDLKAASSAYKQVVKWVIETEDSQLNNRVCWFGSIDGFAADVLSACERAVTLKPTDGGYYDSRGVARVLTGDYEGAIEDFKFFIKWINENDKYKQLIPERESWITQLEEDKNPLDSETLKAIRDQ